MQQLFTYRIYSCICVYINVCICVCVHICICIRICICVCICKSICICVGIYVHVYVYVYVYAHSYIYIVLQTLYIYSSVYNIYMYNVYVFGNFDILILQMRITHECIQVQLGPVVDGCPEWPCTPVNASGSDPWKKRGRKIGTRMEVS
jgi:hypothetical protein